ncbi:NUDIX domain-containing protein [Mesorhizobium sp. M7A.F.Ca.MR.148.00.0.0]|uniref:NUDIX domain-containing protein n=1 Tax=Mesorhizobium sp. M7A.F.Ca.MR.148.00.0.0 TaxID=2496775 RepID=UPI0019D11779|nr:NUDIX domain-containing protein [Mesorhizobium sp. M7A.F.Ca.MR.148.00.0.0]
MPATSEAPASRGVLSIPKPVGEEFAMDSAGQAASLMLVAPDGDVLVLRRSSTDTSWPGHWCWPGGKSDEGEDAETTAARETTEEVGTLPSGTRQHIDARATPNGWVHHTFAQAVEKKFAPVLTDEHSGYAWAPLRSLPEPLHPGLRDMLGERLGIASDMSPEAFDELSSNFVKWTRGEDIAPEQVAANDALAMDRNSIRIFDQDGHLRVEMTPISKANVCPYYGREIPDFEALGLVPERVYRLYRDADELAKAAPTFVGKAAAAQAHPGQRQGPSARSRCRRAG